VELRVAGIVYLKFGYAVWFFHNAAAYASGVLSLVESARRYDNQLCQTVLVLAYPVIVLFKCHRSAFPQAFSNQGTGILLVNLTAVQLQELRNVFCYIITIL